MNQKLISKLAKLQGQMVREAAKVLLVAQKQVTRSTQVMTVKGRTAIVGSAGRCYR